MKTKFTDVTRECRIALLGVIKTVIRFIIKPHTIKICRLANPGPLSSKARPFLWEEFKVFSILIAKKNHPNIDLGKYERVQAEI